MMPRLVPADHLPTAAPTGTAFQVTPSGRNPGLPGGGNAQPISQSDYRRGYRGDELYLGLGRLSTWGNSLYPLSIILWNVLLQPGNG